MVGQAKNHKMITADFQVQPLKIIALLATQTKELQLYSIVPPTP